MLLLTTHCKAEPAFGKCNLFLKERNEERCFSGRLKVKSVNAALRCDSVCRSWPYRQVRFDRALHLYFSIISCFTLHRVAAGSR